MCAKPESSVQVPDVRETLGSCRSLNAVHARRVGVDSVYMYMVEHWSVELCRFEEIKT